MAEIVLDKVSKIYPDGTAAVREADFTVADGELFILVGPSGCGKSTLLNMIVGLEDISSGELRVGGRRLNEVDPKDRNMAMVFQSYALYPHMTVRQNMAFPLELARRPREEIRRRVEEAAGLLELTEHLDRKPRHLSGGQRQRVAMGRALVREPAAFLLDEPLSNLDAKLRVQMRTELARLQRRLGTTTVYVTHDQTEAMTLGDRVAVLRRGAVQQVASPRELYTRPANLFVAGFIGSPAMSFVPAEVRGERLALPLGEGVELPLPADLVDRAARVAGRRLVAGIRPEHLRPAPPAADAAGTAGAAEEAASFTVRVDVVEWTGAEAYAYFDVEAPSLAGLEQLAEGLEREGQGARRPMVARLDPERPVGEGEEIRLRLDAARLHLFDAESGARLAADRS